MLLLPLSFLTGLVLLLWAGTKSDWALVRFCTKTALTAMLATMLSVPAFFVLAVNRWDHDQRACSIRRDGTDPEAVACMEARRESRWGPWKTLGRTADITYEDD